MCSDNLPEITCNTYFHERDLCRGCSDEPGLRIFNKSSGYRMPNHKEIETDVDKFLLCNTLKLDETF